MVVMSMHRSFYEVDPLRDGKVCQSTSACDPTWTYNFLGDGIFANPEEGLNYQHKEPEYPSPEELKSEKELKESMLNFVPENARTSFMRERHVEIRPTRPVNPFQPAA